MTRATRTDDLDGLYDWHWCQSCRYRVEVHDGGDSRNDRVGVRVRVRCLHGRLPNGTTSDCPRWDPCAEHEHLLGEDDLDGLDELDGLDGLDELDMLTDPADQAGAQANAYAPDLTPYPFEQLCDRLEALGPLPSADPDGQPVRGDEPWGSLLLLLRCHHALRVRIG